MRHAGQLVSLVLDLDKRRKAAGLAHGRLAHGAVFRLLVEENLDRAMAVGASDQLHLLRLGMRVRLGAAQRTLVRILILNVVRVTPFDRRQIGQRRVGLARPRLPSGSVAAVGVHDPCGRMAQLVDECAAQPIGARHHLVAEIDGRRSNAASVPSGEIQICEEGTNIKDMFTSVDCSSIRLWCSVSCSM